MSFASAHPGLAAALVKREYNEPTSVQSAVLEAAPDRDLLVSAQTGSGKTVAFGLGIAPTLLGTEPRLPRAGMPLALVITPTRELAQQVFRELAWLYAETGARIATCVGGFDPQRERHALAQGVHIVVGTPGRLCDHLERGALKLEQIRAVVLDEADEMLDMGFREDLQRLLDAAPDTRRTLLFSATIPRDIATLAKKYQKDALRIATQSETAGHRDIAYRAIPILPRERDLAVVNVLRYHEAAGALVFCATRDGVTHLAANLAERGFSVAALSGELSQRERNQALQALRDRRARVCVATDVAARGLDLPDLGLVIHADLPQNAQAMVHRSGRTGRAGKHGEAIVLVPDMARRYVERMFQAAHVEVTWSRGPSAEEILARDSEALVVEIGELAAEMGEEDREVARKLLAERSAEELVGALVRLRREARPSPEELTLPPSMRPRGEMRGNERPMRGERPMRDERPMRGNDRPQRDERPMRPRDERPARDERPVREARPAPAPRAAATELPEILALPQQPAERPTSGFGPVRPVMPSIPSVMEAIDEAEHARDVSRSGKRQRGPSAPLGESGTAWFTINVGRSKNADPKWIVPLLCRRGGITKKEIGKIQILQRETRVEIAADARDRFAEAVRVPDTKDRHIHIEPLDNDAQA